MATEEPVEVHESLTSALETPLAMPPKESPRQYGAPRRFGIGTILVVMASASLLLALLIARGAPAHVIMHVVVFLTLVGFGQALLFKGRNPRLASVVSGAVLTGLYVLGLLLFRVFTSLYYSQWQLVQSLILAFTFTLIGGVFGYLGGGIIGGLFLAMDHWEAKFGRRDRESTLFDPFAPQLREVAAFSEKESGPDNRSHS